MKTFRNLRRSLSQSKTAMTLNVMGLSIAFAAFLIILIQVHFDRSFDSCHPDADLIYRAELGISGQRLALISSPMIDFIAQSPRIETSAMTWNNHTNTPYTVIHNDSRTLFHETSLSVSPSFTEVFHFEMAEGSDKALNEPGQILIPESVARRFFGEESAIGKQIESQGSPLTVGGVYKDFPKNSTVQNFVYSAIPQNSVSTAWEGTYYNGYFKVTPGENMEEEIARLDETLRAASKMNNPDMPEISLRLTPLKDLHYLTGVTYDFTPKGDKRLGLILLTIAFAILLIGGINYMNFNMALAPKRIKTINIRRVLGATDQSIRFNYLLEPILLSLFAFAVGLCLVYLSSKTFIAGFVDPALNPWAYPELTAIAALAAVVLGVFSGLYPAHYVTSFQPALVLQGSFGGAAKARGFRKVLIGVQFTAAFVLIISTWFMYLQNDYMRHAEMGYDRDNIIFIAVNDQARQNKEAFTNELKSFAGIEEVTYADGVLSYSDVFNGMSAEYEGQEFMFHWIPVEPSFLETMGIELSEGRDFRESDRQTTGKLIFNEAAKNQFGLRLNSLIKEMEIIGFIPDIQHTTFRTSPPPMAFCVGYTENLPFAYVKLLPGSDKEAALKHISKVSEDFKILPTDLSAHLYADLLDTTYAKEEQLAKLIALFSLIAIFISMIGIFGLVFFENEYRQKEISIRKVLGSTEIEILALFNRTYLTILGICFIIACPVAYYAINRWFENFAEHTPFYWWVFLISGIAVTIVTSTTVSLQSWKTATSNPLKALQN